MPIIGAALQAGVGRMRSVPGGRVAVCPDVPPSGLGGRLRANSYGLATILPSRYCDYMTSRVSELVIDCLDPVRLADFWCEVLGFVELGREDGSIEIGPRETGFGGLQPTIVFEPCSSAKAGKLRMHFDVNPTDCDQENELARLLAAGARHVDIGQTGDESWYVLSDPEGNEFCLLRTKLSSTTAIPSV